MKYETLKKVIPADQALANKALAQSLQQVKNIFNTTLSDLSPVMQELETNKDLPLIQNLNTPVPDSIISTYTSLLANGTGPNNSLTLNDVIGTAAGVTHKDQLPVSQQVLQDLDNDGQLDVLTADAGPSSSGTGVYTVMQYCLNGNYTIDAGGPGPYTVLIPSGVYGAGSYGPYGSEAEAIDDAFANGLIPAASTLISAIAAANAALTEQANQSYTLMAQQLKREKDNQSLAQINYTNLEANSKSALFAITTNLHTIGLDTTQGGSAQYFEAIADMTSLSGQAVIASMREGRNIRRLNDIGINLDTQIAPLTNTTKADLLPAQDTVAEAASKAQQNQ